jgi:hypothetical protein
MVHGEFYQFSVKHCWKHINNGMPTGKISWTMIVENGKELL